jgi:hypothetical protein
MGAVPSARAGFLSSGGRCAAGNEPNSGSAGFCYAESWIARVDYFICGTWMVAVT